MFSTTWITLLLASILNLNISTAYVIPTTGSSGSGDDSSAMTLPSHHKFTLPASNSNDKQLQRRADAISILQTIAPTSNSCSGGSDECATAAQAVPALLSSFATYSVTTGPEQAALLSWMAFESGDFKYRINHFPGVPGQGTRCMMSPGFVAQFAAASHVGAGLTDPAAVLAAVNAAGLDFAAAAWFYTTHCSQAVRDGVRTGGRAGWEAFVTGCVQTTLTDARTQYWLRAVGALGVQVS